MLKDVAATVCAQHFLASCHWLPVVDLVTVRLGFNLEVQQHWGRAAAWIELKMKNQAPEGAPNNDSLFCGSPPRQPPAGAAGGKHLPRRRRFLAISPVKVHQQVVLEPENHFSMTQPTRKQGFLSLFPFFFSLLLPLPFLFPFLSRRSEIGKGSISSFIIWLNQSPK